MMRTVEWISEGIKEECKKKKITYYSISIKAKIPKSTIMNIVNLKINNPGIKTIEKICSGLNMSFTDFVNTYYF